MTANSSVNMLPSGFHREDDGRFKQEAIIDAFLMIELALKAKTLRLGMTIQRRWDYGRCADAWYEQSGALTVKYMKRKRRVATTVPSVASPGDF